MAQNFRKGASVEVWCGPDVEGFEESYWTAAVLWQGSINGQGMVTVQYDELLEEDGATHMVETVVADRVRPACPDDSVTVPLAARNPGDAVDCWHCDGWWEGYVHRVYNRHVTVYFPRSGQEYCDVVQPAHPPDPAAHRVRTGMAWDAGQRRWHSRPRQVFVGAGNFRPTGTRWLVVAAEEGGAAPLRSCRKAGGSSAEEASSRSRSRSREEEVKAASSSTSSEDEQEALENDTSSSSSSSSGSEWAESEREGSLQSSGSSGSEVDAPHQKRSRGLAMVQLPRSRQ